MPCWPPGPADHQTPCPGAPQMCLGNHTGSIPGHGVSARQGIMVLRHPVSKVVMERHFSNGIKRQIQRVGKAHSAKLMISKQSLEPGSSEEPKGRGGEVTSLLSPCSG